MGTLSARSLSCGSLTFDELLKQACAGDRTALGLLLHAHKGFLFHLTRATIPPELAHRLEDDDLVQVTNLLAFRFLHRFNGSTPDEFRAWLRITLLRALLKVRRAHQQNKRALYKERAVQDADLLAGPPCSSPLDELIKQERVPLLRLCLAQLCERHRQVISLRHFEELTFPQIGAQLQISETGATSLYRRACAALEGILRERGVTLDE